MDFWLSSGYATFSSMVRESNSALSWNSMPILAADVEEVFLAHGGEFLSEGEDPAGIRLHQTQRGL
jgi:hypothetical protein